MDLFQQVAVPVEKCPVDSGPAGDAVPPIASSLRPGHVLIQHYDAAYSAPDYRIAQAIWLQRQFDGQHLPTLVLPGASGLRFTLGAIGILGWDICLDDSPAAAIGGYLRSVLSRT